MATSGGIFDYAEKKDRLDEIDAELAQGDIWANDPDKAQAFGQEKARLEEVVRPHSDMDVGFRLDVESDEADGEEPDLWRRPEVLYGLGNFVENAADFAENEVTVTARYSPEEIAVEIVDDGPGFGPDVLERLGEPYVTTRPRRKGAPADPEHSHQGMGLGFFIGKTLLERTGATVHIGNREDGPRGARVYVAWPRHLIEADPAFPERAEGGE